MSMSTYVTGIIPADSKYLKMLHIFNECKEVGIDPPKEVWDFFRGEIPDPDGVVVSLVDIAIEYSHEMSQGVSIDVDKIPKQVKTIRFVNSW